MRKLFSMKFGSLRSQLFPVFYEQENAKKKVLVPALVEPVPERALRLSATVFG